MKIIIDAMGGDFAPEAPVRGALLAREKYGADIILTGRTADILRELEKAGCKEVPQGIEIANAEEVVEICDDPATAFKQKKDSSLTVGLNLLRDGHSDLLPSWALSLTPKQPVRSTRRNICSKRYQPSA